jgi:uncharacterized membrane-anchored protein YitT (DUF2179 family)
MKLACDWREWYRRAKNILLVIVGTLILSFGTAIFLIPFELVTGGVSGYAIVIKHVLPAEFLSHEALIAIITWVLFFIGLFVLGKSFALKTLISTVVYPIGTALFAHLLDPGFFGGFFNLAASSYSEISIVLAAVFSGIFVGLGCSLSFLGGGSTGGVDIIAFTLCKFFKRLKSSVVLFVIDATAVVLGMFVIGDFVVSLLGIVSAFIAATVIDKVFVGGNRAFVAHIVTDKADEINEKIITDLDRTTTVFKATGGYSKDNKTVLMVSFTMNQYADLMAIINKIDRDAFLTIHRAHEINGEGWTKYDIKKKSK